ncbi:MAG: acetolactate synthase large subunit, partial [Fibrobacter sp.]|nr:acetolactate synthase large subunit [Fibrobacter sp.]
AYANPDKKVVCFTGDGSLLMNIQELATLADLNLNLAVILFNNGHLGLVRQQQEMFYNQNFIASQFTRNPDFITIAEGFGIRSYDLESTDEPVSLLAKALSEKGPCLINVPIQHSLKVLPMVPPGAANIDSIGG